MESSYSELNKTSYLVSTEWLADHLNDPGLVLVDCRYYFDGRDGLSEYGKGHLPGAVHLDWSKKLVDPASPRPGTFKLPSPDHLREALGTVGNIRFEHGRWL